MNLKQIKHVAEDFGFETEELETAYGGIYIYPPNSESQLVLEVYKGDDRKLYIFIDSEGCGIAVRKELTDSKLLKNKEILIKYLNLFYSYYIQEQEDDYNIRIKAAEKEIEDINEERLKYLINNKDLNQIKEKLNV